MLLTLPALNHPKIRLYQLRYVRLRPELSVLETDDRSLGGGCEEKLTKCPSISEIVRGQIAWPVIVWTR
jgi:hypothetical protein